MAAIDGTMNRMKNAFLILVALAVAGVAPLAYAQTVEYMHTDALGSVVAITDAAGNVTERNEYEPYGNDLTGVKDGPGYTGHVSDAATGLSYMQQRYYDPQLGVFLSVDPVTSFEGDMRHLNRYRYAYDNPYIFTDPDGRSGCFTGTRVSCGAMLKQMRNAVVHYVARQVANAARNAAKTAKNEAKRALSENTYTAQVGVGATIAAPMRSKSPMAGSIAATGSVNVGLNNHGQIFVTASGAPMVGQGGGATAGVQYGAGFAEGGPSPKGFSRSTNHHFEAALSIPEVPVSGGGSFDWNSEGRSGAVGSARLSAGQMLFYGGGEQVNLTYTFNNPPGEVSE